VASAPREDAAAVVMAAEQPPPPKLAHALKPPPRLNPSVRQALQSILPTIDADAGTVSAFVIDAGVFIPLVEFERRGIDTAVAVKALCDKRMLATDPLNPHAKTVSRTVSDERILGVVLAPQFVTGLDASRFAPAAPPEARR
jgi:conjugal transfer pilus assembly protein TraI